MNENLFDDWMALQSTVWGAGLQQMTAWQTAWMNACLQMQREWIEQVSTGTQGLPWVWPSVAGAEQLA